jgi:hypothetical protein
VRGASSVPIVNSWISFVSCAKEFSGPSVVGAVIFWISRNELRFTLQIKSGLKGQVKGKSKTMSINDLEFAYAPARDQVRDLREYL